MRRPFPAQCGHQHNGVKYYFRAHATALAASALVTRPSRNFFSAEAASFANRWVSDWRSIFFITIESLLKNKQVVILFQLEGSFGSSRQIAITRFISLDYLFPNVAPVRSVWLLYTRAAHAFQFVIHLDHRPRISFNAESSPDTLPPGIGFFARYKPRPFVAPGYFSLSPAKKKRPFSVPSVPLW